MTQLPTTPGAVIGYTKRGTEIRVIAGAALNVDSLPTETDAFQTYLDELQDNELPRLEEALAARFNELMAKDDPDTEHVERLTGIRNQFRACKAEDGKRKADAAANRASETAAAHREAIQALASDVNGDEPDNPPEPDPTVETDEGVDALSEKFAAVIAQAFAKAQPVVASSAGPNLNRHIRDMPLSAIGQHAPDPKVAPARKEAVLVASADIPGVAKNGRVDGIRQLVTLMGDRSRMLSTTRGKPNYVAVAKLQRDFRYRLNLDSTPDEVNEVLTAATDVSALVAAGGWCAPSEISYDFFNIVCEDGLIDLPSVGILNRGGFRFPTSPTIANIFGDGDVLWSWTEQQDISAADNGDTKTCARVPCPEFDEVRAACDGLCVTAGNLTDYAYPELIENYLRLVMAARAHRTNQLVLGQLESASTPVSVVGNTGEGAAASILNAIELQVIDYRERFRMCADAVLEAVFPRWVLGAIRADLANRTGVDLLGVSNAMIADWLDMRSVRAQFVTDWQSGFDTDPFGDPDTIATAWPSEVDFLLYAPGTFVRGQALQLDLGVVRDSTLNTKNDHTASWMEDCYAVAQVGHESRLVTAGICTAGTTGAADITCGS